MCQTLFTRITVNFHRMYCSKYSPNRSSSFSENWYKVGSFRLSIQYRHFNASRPRHEMVFQRFFGISVSMDTAFKAAGYRIAKRKSWSRFQNIRYEISYIAFFTYIFITHQVQLCGQYICAQFVYHTKEIVKSLSVFIY